MEPIKKTKGIIMEGDASGVWITILDRNGRAYYKAFVPIKVVFQVRRGLESYIQRFYRRRRR